MSFSHEYNFPVYLGTGSVLTTGHSSDLKPGQLDIFNAKTYDAVSAGSKPDTEVFIAGGSWHKVDKLGRFTGGLKQSDKTPKFLIKDIHSFEKSTPRVGQAESWVIGWDGINDADTLSFECGRMYRFKVKVYGQDAYSMFTRPLEREIGFTTECCTGDDCSTDCPDGTVSNKKYAKLLAKYINEDPELKYFVRADARYSVATSHTATHTVYRLDVPDDGTQVALAAVQSQYPNSIVEKVARTANVSTYQIALLEAAPAPADYEVEGTIALADCAGACPAGFSTVTAKKVYLVDRQVLTSTDINSDADKQTFATAVAVAYNGSAAGKFLGYVSGIASIQVKVATSVTLSTPINSDILSYLRTDAAYCTPPAGLTIAWIEFASKYKVSRTLQLTLEKTCGSATRLADLIAFYASDTEIVANSLVIDTTGNCNDIYQVEQYNKELLEDGCFTEGVPTYNELPAFEGFMWKEIVVEDSDVDTKAGVIITAAYEDTRFGGCSFFPTDYYSVRPLRLEITAFLGLGVMDKEGDGVPCVDQVPSRKIRNPSMPTQSGEWAIRTYINGAKYRVHGEFYADPRLREVLDSTALDVIDRDKNYIVYTLKFQQNRGGQNHVADFSPEVLEVPFLFAQGTDTSGFETRFQAITAQAGVFLTNR